MECSRTKNILSQTHTKTYAWTHTLAGDPLKIKLEGGTRWYVYKICEIIYKGSEGNQLLLLLPLFFHADFRRKGLFRVLRDTVASSTNICYISLQIVLISS